MSYALSQLTPLVPRKSPPTPPEGWVYYGREHNTVLTAKRPATYIVARTGMFHAEGPADLPADELVTVAKFLRRLAKWHARREAKP